MTKRHVKEKLVEFLYLLMRDSAPTGEIVRVIRQLNVNPTEQRCYSSKELQAYAERLAEEVLSAWDVKFDHANNQH